MSRVLPCVVVLLLSFPTVGRADPVNLTSGFVIFTDEPGSFELVGPGLQLTGAWFPSTVAGTFWFNQCSPVACAPGSFVDFGTTTYRFSASDTDETISGVVSGTPYSALFVDADLTFTGPRVQAPLVGDSSASRFGPFAMEGHITIYGDSSRSGAPLFAGDLRGSGMAEATFGLHDAIPAGFQVNELRYEFASAEPVPEPSTLLLTLAGAALFGRRRLRSSSVRQIAARRL